MALWSGSAPSLYIDLGTANTLIAARGRGVIANEPTLIAYMETRPGRRKFVAAGLEAVEKLASDPGHFLADRPLRDGVIANFEATEELLRYLFVKYKLTGFFSKPGIIVSLPFGATEVEKKAVVEAGKLAGAKEVFLIDEPMAAALGAGLPVRDARGSLVVDIGGGTTEVAVIALTDIVSCSALRVGGHKMDTAIQDYFRKKKNFVITERIAENLKRQLGTATPKTQITTIEIEGRNAESGVPMRLNISSEEVGQAIESCIGEIVAAVHDTLGKTPPELVSDVIETGLTLCGGGALIKNIHLRLQNEVHIPVRVAENPLTAIARGGEMVLADPELLEKIQLEI
jgi:rod shape-determining protein MreB and related proteins